MVIHYGCDTDSTFNVCANRCIHYISILHRPHVCIICMYSRICILSYAHAYTRSRNRSSKGDCYTCTLCHPKCSIAPLILMHICLQNLTSYYVSVYLSIKQGYSRVNFAQRSHNSAQLKNNRTEIFKHETDLYLVEYVSL